MSYFLPSSPGYSFIPRATTTIIDETNEPVTFDEFMKIIIILDESGSMETIQEQMVKAINDLIKEQKQIKETPATFTLVKFNNTIRRIIKNRLLNNVNLLTSADYTPSGSTALYDAIGTTIEWFKNEKNVLMVIVTDGQENSSRTYSRSMINHMIEEKKTYSGWSYVYLSNDLSTEKQGNDIGLKKSNYSSNCKVKQENYGDFLGSELNVAISNCRKYNVSVQSQLNSN